MDRWSHPRECRQSHKTHRHCFSKKFAFLLNFTNVQLTNSEQNKYDTFQNEIVQNGVHPREAAAKAGDTNYRKLAGTENQFEIRLSQGARATFLVDDATQVVTMMQLGGHTRSKIQCDCSIAWVSAFRRILFHDFRGVTDL